MSSQHAIHYGRGSHAIHFFRVMLSPELHDGVLRIPRGFVEKYSRGVFSNPIFFTLPNGSEWKMPWITREGDIWLQKNYWKKFASFLGLGYLLLFKYKGGSRFEVIICDQSTVEIDYSSIKCNSEDEGSDDEGAETLNDSEKHTQPHKKKKTNSNGSGVKSYVETNGAPSQRTKTGKRKINVDSDAATHAKVPGASRGDMVKAKNCSRTEADKERARNCHSDQNPSFIMTLQKSYVQRHTLVLPCEFSRNYLCGEEAAFVRVGDDRPRKMRLKFDHTNGRSFLSGSWKSFCQQHNLQVGDRCKFEMTQREPVLFTISILIRARDEPSTHQLQGYINGNKADRQQNKDKAESGQFGRKRKGVRGTSRGCPKTHVLGNSEGRNMEQNAFEASIKSLYACIPKDFLNRHGIGHGKTVQLKEGETSWPVTVIYYPRHGYARFSGGWSEFVSGSKLQIGDTCLFELIDQEKLVFKVSIVL